jgi:dTDP-4-amino-4,6-dideoxygalactose transaminase
MQECYRFLGFGPGDFPESEKAASETLALPVFPELTKEQIEYVVEQVAGFYKGK